MFLLWLYIRSLHAVAVVYSLLLNNYCLSSHIFTLQMQLTTALSQLTESLNTRSERYLQQSISALTLLSNKACELWPSYYYINNNKTLLNHQTFHKKLQILLGRLTTILSDSMEIRRQSNLQEKDSSISENLLVQVANSFSHIPEIRISWLNRLAIHHETLYNYAESAQCYLLMASLVRSKGGKDPNNSTAIYTGDYWGMTDVKQDEQQQQKTSSSTSSTSSLHDDNDHELDLTSIEGEGYSLVDTKSQYELDALTSQYYEQACKMFDKAELYEQCSDVYKLLQPLYHKYRDYIRLSTSHAHLHDVFNKLIEANKQQSRMLGTYYRVGFYGYKFGNRLNGNEFIYKMPKITRLMEVTTRLKNLYSNLLGVNVRVLQDSSPVDINKLDPEECILQITYVSPYFPDKLSDREKDNNHHHHDDHQVVYQSATCLSYEYTPTAISIPLRPRQSWIEQTTHLQAFKFSTPFTSSGKAFGSVTEQHKRNTVLYVKYEFPHIVTAQLVIKKEESILSPIQSATEDVISRTNSLLESLSPNNLNAKALTGLLAGSVATR